MLDLVGKPEDRFSHIDAHISENNYKVRDKRQHETKKEELPKGQIDNIVASKGEIKHRLESFQYEEEFVTVDHDGLACLSVWNEATASKSKYFALRQGNVWFVFPTNHERVARSI